MTRNKAPIRYTIQSGVAGAWAGGGGIGGSTAGTGGAGGGTGDIADGCGGIGNIIDGDAGGDTDGAEGDSVVKAPTALQALWVLELIALTFQ